MTGEARSPRRSLPSLLTWPSRARQDRRCLSSRRTSRGHRIRAGDTVPRCRRSDGGGVDAGVAGADAGRRRGTERAVLRARRRRLRPAVVLRRSRRHAEHRSGGGERPALRQHAHDRAVLADAVVHPDRPQPPLERGGVHHGAGHRLPRLRRSHAVRERDVARDAGRAGLQHVLPRQVAPVAVGGQHAGRAVPPLAARPRLRALLRLPRRRDEPVVPGPDPGQRLGPPAAARRRTATTSARTSPTRRSR